MVERETFVAITGNTQADDRACNWGISEALGFI